MNYQCPECQKLCLGEKSEDPLLPPAIICEYCGAELELLPQEAPEYDS